MKPYFPIIAVTLASAPVTAAPRHDVSVVTANMLDFNDLSPEGDWHQRYSNLVTQIVGSGQPPDIIAMTETGGWQSCWSGTTAQDYDAFDQVIHQLHVATGVQYRIAFFVGAPGNFATCNKFSGSAILYNPTRIFNRTPIDASHAPIVASDWTGNTGLHFRRSMPICSRGTNLEPLASLIDGNPTIEKCSTATPNGPAWTWDVNDPGAQYRVSAALGRFSFVSEPLSSFDVVVVHTNANFTGPEAAPIDAFVTAMASSPYRTMPRTLPTIVTGDYNALSSNPTWLTGFAQVFFRDDMATSLGSPPGAATPNHGLSFTTGALLPADDTTCNSKPADGISDHCALRNDFDFTSPWSTPPPLPPYTTASFWYRTTQLASPVVDWAPNEFKAECDNASGVTGLSAQWFAGDARAALCRADGPAVFPHASCHTMSVPAGQRGTTATGDWAVGFEKGECALNEYVAGVSQYVWQIPDPDEHDSLLTIDEILCCPGMPHNTTCTAEVILPSTPGGLNNREATDSWDWSPGDDMAECGPGRYVAGVSITPDAGPHSILCCNKAPPPPPKDPTDPICKGGVHNPSCN